MSSLKFLKIKNERDDVIFAESVFEAKDREEVIPEALVLAKKAGKTIVFKTPFEFEITKYMNKEEALRVYDVMFDATKQKQAIKFKAYERGKLEEEATKERESFVFKSTQEAIEAIKKIKPINLFDKDLTMNEATDWALKMMYIIAKCDGLKFNQDEIKEFSKELRKKGALTIDELDRLHSPLVESKGLALNLDKATKTPNNLLAPLSFLTTLTRPFSDASFNRALKEFSAGGIRNNIFVGNWINAQESYNKKEKDKYDDYDATMELE